MPTIFSETIKELRKEAGFRTAYQFYHSNGGKNILKVSYRGWLLTEEGKNLPPFKILGTLMYTLRCIPCSENGTRLILSWLRTAHGEEDFRQFLEPLFKFPRNSIASPLHKVIHRSLSNRKVHITPLQVETIAKSTANYLCWVAMSNDTGKWDAKALASQLGLPVSAAEKATKDLKAAGLLKEPAKGLYKCPMPDAMREFPRTRTSVPALKKLMALRTALVAQGDVLYSRSGILRANQKDLANFFPLFSLNLSSAEAYAVTEKAKGTALFSVEGRIVKIRDF